MRRMDRESENKANAVSDFGNPGACSCGCCKIPTGTSVEQSPDWSGNRRRRRIIRLWACQVVGGTLERKNPEIVKQNEIERKDERNQLIRSKAQALSGEILHWLLMGGAWAAILLDAPLWVTLAFVGVFLLKTVLDLAFIAYYQRRM